MASSRQTLQGFFDHLVLVYGVTCTCMLCVDNCVAMQ